MTDKIDKTRTTTITSAQAQRVILILANYFGKMYCDTNNTYG